MKKNRTLLVLVALLLLVGIGTFTYARYITNKSGNATVNVAKWSAVLTDGTNELSNNFTLTLQPTSSDLVAAGKIAPGSTATGTLVVNLTGTEVASDVIVTAGTITGAPTGATLTIKEAGDASATTLSSGTSLTKNLTAAQAATGVLTYTITVEWPNNEANNESDTTIGEAASSAITVPLTVVAKQRISTDS